MLKQEHALPCSQGGSTVDHRNGFAASGQGHSEMARAVVRAFVGVNEKGQIFGNQMIKKGMKICPRESVSIFHDDQARAGVLHEYRHLPL